MIGGAGYPAAQAIAASRSASGKGLISPGLIQPNHRIAWVIHSTSVTKCAYRAQFVTPSFVSSQMASGSMPSNDGNTITSRMSPSSAALATAE